MTVNSLRDDTWLARASAALTAAPVLYLVATISDPLRMNWGDPWSDSNVQTSGAIFAREGFIRNAFVPTIDLTPLPAHPLRYTHYPPLPDIVNGVEQSLFGPRDITVYRIVALALTFTALTFFYHYVRRTWSRQTALFTLPLFAFNILFLQYADTIHHIPLYWSSGFGALAASAIWLQEKKRWSLFACITCTFICFMSSYDFFFFLPIMFVSTIMVLKSDWRERGVRVLLAVVTAGIALAISAKTLCVIAAIGPRGFWKDLVHQFLERATPTYAVDYREGLWTLLLGRVWRLFGPLFFIALFAHAVAVVDWLRRRPRTGEGLTPSPLLVLCAGIPFVALFSQLFCEQYHPTLGFLPYFAIGGGSLLAYIWAQGTRRSRTLAFAGLGLCVTWQTIEVARFPKVFLPREDVAEISDILARTDHRRFVLTNSPVDAVTRAYWNRHAMGLPLSHEGVYLRELFDAHGHEGSITAVEYLLLDRAVYDKLLYGFFVAERRWQWMARPFEKRHEWRKRMGELSKNFSSSIAPFGTVMYESPSFRVRSITLRDVDRVQRERLPAGETRFVDFETRDADRYELYGFGYPEQYERHHGFAWLRARYPTELQFTLKGLLFEPVGAPILKSALRVRLSPGRDYRVLAFGWTEFSDQTLSLRLNASERVETILAASPTGPRDYAFTIPKESLNADGVQDLEFSYRRLDKYGNALLFHSITFEPITD